MAGTTTTTTGVVSTPSKPSTSSLAASTGDARTYRVAIDVPRIQANVFAHEGGRLTDLAVRNWLRSVGFNPEAGGAGNTWLADRDSLGRLDQSEILSVELMREAFPEDDA
jgi:hypothetical protein